MGGIRTHNLLIDININIKRTVGYGAGHLGTTVSVPPLRATDSAPTGQAPGLYGAGIIRRPPFQRSLFR